MEANNKSYFGEIGDALKSLATGLKVTLKEYFTKKSTEQYPENRKTTLHVAQRHRGRLVMKRDENGVVKCVACTLCEKACPNGTIKIASEMVTTEEGKKKRRLVDYQYDLVTACSVSFASMRAASTQSSLRMISRTVCSTATSWCSTLTRSITRARCQTSSMAVHR